MRGFCPKSRPGLLATGLLATFGLCVVQSACSDGTSFSQTGYDAARSQVDGTSSPANDTRSTPPVKSSKPVPDSSESVSSPYDWQASENLLVKQCGVDEPDIPDEIPPPTTIDELEALCAEMDTVSIEQEVHFPDPDNACAFGENGNLDRREEFVTARIEQKAALNVDGIICNLKLVFPQQKMKYDDEVFFTFNDAILASSTNQNDRFSKVDGFFRYEWDRLRNARYVQNERGTYCYGADLGKARCVFPKTEQEGTLAFSFDDGLVKQLSLLAEKQKRREFGFITTGDNNDTDCHHSDFKFRVIVDYLPR